MLYISSEKINSKVYFNILIVPSKHTYLLFLKTYLYQEQQCHYTEYMFFRICVLIHFPKILGNLGTIVRPDLLWYSVRGR